MPLRTSKRREEALRTLEKVWAETQRINDDLRSALNELREGEGAAQDRAAAGLDREQKRAVSDLRAEETK